MGFGNERGGKKRLRHQGEKRSLERKEQTEKDRKIYFTLIFAVQVGSEPIVSLYTLPILNFSPLFFLLFVDSSYCLNVAGALPHSGMF